MPELPEVETVRSQLEPVLVGQTIKEVVVLREKSWSSFAEASEDKDGMNPVIGAEIVAVKRKAKVLFLKLRSTVTQWHGETAYLMVHLKMTGQLIYDLDGSDISREDRIVGGHPNNSWTNSLPDNHTRVIIELDKGTLFFNDMRVFGWVRLVSSEQVNELLGSMPPDIIDDECDQEYFYKMLQRSGRAVKLRILDSKQVGGIGNIYACDGLFDAGIDPRKPANELTKKESDKLLASLKKVVNRGIELGGATAADGKFVNTDGLGGSYQDEFLVYEQEGEIRERDGKTGVVEKFKLGGRGTYWVPELQQ